MAPNAFGYARLNLSYWLCAATDCQLPRPISNALYNLVDNHTKPGAIAQYTCFNGYVPQSKSKFVCNVHCSHSLDAGHSPLLRTNFN